MLIVVQMVSGFERWHVMMGEWEPCLNMTPFWPAFFPSLQSMSLHFLGAFLARIFGLTLPSD